MIPSDLSPLANHLWQSTLFLVAAGLLTTVLTKNRAAVRYWLWLAASVKFLVPFSLMVMLGNQLAWRSVPADAPPPVPAVVYQISHPFVLPAVTPLVAAATEASPQSPAVLLAVWLGGVLLVGIAWTRQWRRIRAAVRSGTPMDLDFPIRVLSSPARLEPGVFGILRPVLVVPEGLLDHLTLSQWQAILAHELCHVRRRDNLTAAIHMAVEAIFWFHPLVWWVGSRLLHERERACDEAVLLARSDPEVYAEGILNICRFYAESALPCASGVSGSNLKTRIQAIMSGRPAHQLDLGRRLLLAAAGIAAVAGPIVFGLATSPQGQAQPQTAGASPVAFEVASVRPGDRAGDPGGSKSGDSRAQGPSFQVEHKRITATNFNLVALIIKAYGLTGCRPLGGGNCVLLSGGPDWTRKDGFDLAAKMPDNSPDYTLVQLQNGHAPQLQLMLQALLADRFHLKVHHEKRLLPVFQLTVAKNGPKLRKAAESETPQVMFHPSVQANGQQMIQLLVKNSSLQDVADLYAKFMDRPMVDRTGLQDRYDFTLDYESNTEEQGPFAAVTGPAMLRAFQEQAGLKLEATKGSVDVLVIDHAERPSGN